MLFRSLGSALSLNLPTLLVGRALQGVSAAWLTRIAGSSLIVYFQQDQDWGDGGMGEVLQQHYELNRRDGVLRKFLEVAYRQVVEPLRQQRRLPPQPGGRSAPFSPAEREAPLERSRQEPLQRQPRRAQRPPEPLEGEEAGDPNDPKG